MGMQLEYAPPAQRNGNQIIAKIEEDEIKHLNDHWANALIGYVQDDTPYGMSMEDFVTAICDFVSKPQILYHNDGYYVVRFATTEDRDMVMQAGPYTYHNKPYILQNWKRNFYFVPECITTIPLRVNFLGLPVGYLFADAQRKLASAIATPLYTD